MSAAEPVSAGEPLREAEPMCAGEPLRAGEPDSRQHELMREAEAGSRVNEARIDYFSFHHVQTVQPRFKVPA